MLPEASLSISPCFAEWSWQLDGWIVAAGMCCAVAAALLGNFLVLRKMSMLGDAISHAVLPGLAVAFMVTNSRNSLPMFIGAVIVGVLTAFFTEWIRKAGNVDEGASMGVVFTSLFALGLVMIVQAVDHVDLDPGCVLYGAIEYIPLDPHVQLFGLGMPPAVRTLIIVLLINIAFVVVFFKELKISSFDPALSTSAGFNSRIMHYALMVLVAVTAVASFETAGNILVVAMFIVPPATAYMLTHRLSTMIMLSCAFAALSAFLGHVAAITVPGWFGFESTLTAGMMTVVSGLFLAAAVLFAPQRGVITKWYHQWKLSFQILTDDVVALLYRVRERSRRTDSPDSATGLAGLPEDSTTEDPPTFEFIRQSLLAGKTSLNFALRRLAKTALVDEVNGQYCLTDLGIERGSELVRSHRLWEQYLVTQAGLDSSKIHDKAERMEHFTDRDLRQRLDERTDAPSIDPHGSPIPPEKVVQNEREDD